LGEKVAGTGNSAMSIDADRLCIGTFVPVPAGTMRNKWFPFNVARYPTFEERKAIKRGEIDGVRDYEFEIMMETSGGQKQSRSAKGSLEAAWQKYLGHDSTAAAGGKRHGEAMAADIEIKIIEVGFNSSERSIGHANPVQPSRAIALLDVLLPDFLEFERKPVPKPQSHSESKSKLPASVQAMLKASTPEAPTAIYGSVSTNDVAQYIREAVAYNDEAAQIQINESNLKFVDPEEGDDATRIKHLGQYRVEISFKGAETTIQKGVVVKKPQEEVAEAMIDPSIDQVASSAEFVDHR
jgi:ribosomal protein L9